MKTLIVPSHETSSSPLKDVKKLFIHATTWDDVLETTTLDDVFESYICCITPSPVQAFYSFQLQVSRTSVNIYDYSTNGFSHDSSFGRGFDTSLKISPLLPISTFYKSFYLPS